MSWSKVFTTKASMNLRIRGCPKAAVIYIDCDLYDSTIQVLNFIEPYLVNGSIICFDDFYNYKGDPEQGEQKTLAEFMQKETHIGFVPYVTYAPLGKSFICRLK